MGDEASTGVSGIFGLRLLGQPRVQRLALAMILIIFGLVRLAQFLNWTTQIQFGYDFSAYWGAGRNVIDGLPIYQSFQLDGSYSPQQQYLYLYPPFLAVAITPISAAFDDYRIANWLWAGIGALVVILVAAALARYEQITRGRDTLLLIGAALVFAPVVGELVLGNVHLLLLGLLAAAWLALSSGTERGELTAGCLIGVATLIKVFPGLIIVWFLLTGRTRAALAAVLTVAVLAIATLPIIGIEPWLEYPIVLLNIGSPVDTNDVLAPIVWLSTLVSPIFARALVALAGLTVVVWTVRRRADGVSYAVAVAVSILVAPAMYQHYLAVLVLPLVLALRYAAPLGWVVIAYLLMSGGEQEALGDAIWIVNRVLPTLGAMLVVGGLWWFGQRAQRPPTPMTP